MRTALLVADLPGIAGVDALSALVPGTVKHLLACRLLAGEVNAATDGLLGAGFEQVRVFDCHRLGAEAPNLRAGELRAQARLVSTAEPFGPWAFEGAQAVACLGMHAAGGTRGFAAHTFFPQAVWVCGRRVLSEAELVLGLAHGLGVPVLFVAGEGALKARLPTVRFVVTKRSVALHQARSEEAPRVHRALTRAASARARPAPKAPTGPFTLRFKSAWQAAVAEQAGAVRSGPRSVRVEAEGFVARYGRAVELLGATDEVLRRSLRGMPGEACFVEDVEALLRRPARAVPGRSFEARAGRALGAFLERTEGGEDWQRADRALTLHMLEGHAPAFFERRRLGPVLARAVEALGRVERRFPEELCADAAMARVDASYVRAERGVEAPRVPAELAGYLQGLLRRAELLHGWLLGELAVQLGAPRMTPVFGRPYRGVDRERDLYWLTHLFLLDSRYLRRPLTPLALAAQTEELLLASGWVVHNGMVELGAELAFCLQLAGERKAFEHRALLELLAEHQQADGSVLQAIETGRSRAHATAAALLAFAGAAA